MTVEYVLKDYEERFMILTRPEQRFDSTLEV